MKEIFADPQWKEAARLTGCKNIASAQRIDSHHVCIPAWGITLTLQREIPDDIRFVGFRAHEFLPVWKSSEEDPVFCRAVKDRKRSAASVIVIRYRIIGTVQRLYSSESSDIR